MVRWQSGLMQLPTKQSDNFQTCSVGSNPTLTADFIFFTEVLNMIISAILKIKSFFRFLFSKFIYKPAEVFSFVRFKNDENNTDEFEFYIEGHDFLGFPTTFIIDEDSMKQFVDLYNERNSEKYKIDTDETVETFKEF